MSLRAVLFDVYGTLLEIGPAPDDAEALWQGLVASSLGVSAPLSFLAFGAACEQSVARRHALVRSQGIAWPEVDWPSVVAEALPDFHRLAPAAREAFLLRQMRLLRTLRLRAGSGPVLHALSRTGAALGIVSNAQAYSRRELADALAPEALSLASFDPDLCFWSYQHGFSKPDPHVFRILTARLEARGIAPHEILMIGDRLDNDVIPARAHGWRAWHLLSPAQQSGPDSGDWARLLHWLDATP